MSHPPELVAFTQRAPVSLAEAAQKPLAQSGEAAEYLLQSHCSREGPIPPAQLCPREGFVPCINREPWRVTRLREFADSLVNTPRFPSWGSGGLIIAEAEVVRWPLLKLVSVLGGKEAKVSREPFGGPCQGWRTELFLPPAGAGGKMSRGRQLRFIPRSWGKMLLC